MPGESAGESYPNPTGEVEPNSSADFESSSASEWETEMEDMEEFSMERVFESSPTTPEHIEQERTPDQQVATAGLLAAYGLNTACRQYDLKTILTKVYNTDVTSGDAVFNPLGKIYEEIEPRPEARAYLFREIQKDSALDRQHDNDPDSDALNNPLGMTPYGEMYDKRLNQNTQEQTSLDAILALKKLLDSLAVEPRFENLRQRANKEGKSIIDLLVGNTINPTLTTFLTGVNGELSASSVEEILDEIEVESSADPEPTNADNELIDSFADSTNTQDDTGELDNSSEITEDTAAATNPDTFGDPLDDEVTNAILAKFNQPDNAETAQPRRKSSQDFLSDAEFKDILNDESIRRPAMSEFDSEEIIMRLKNQIPPDYEESAKLAKARKSGNLPTD